MSKILTYLSVILPISSIGLGLGLASVAVRSLLDNTKSLECFCPSCEQLAFAEKGVAQLGLIRVDIQGAVRKPGIYQLEIGQRLADLLTLAGGFLKDADQKHVAKNLNLALELKNQDKIYIPFAGEQDLVVIASNSGNTSSATQNLISINQADLAKLQTLSGIGEVKGQAIIDGRPYTSLEELVSKKVLSENLFNDLKAQLTL